MSGQPGEEAPTARVGHADNAGRADGAGAPSSAGPGVPEDAEWLPPPGPEPSDAELAGYWPDPYAGPPDGDDAWLADLAAEQLDALARELATARAGIREPIPAGFTHRDAAPSLLTDSALTGDPPWDPSLAGPRTAGPAMGFAAGAALDLAPPGPVLASFAQETMDEGLAALTDDELIGLLCAARRMTSWQAATELSVAAELDARRRREAAARRAAAAGSRSRPAAAASSEVGEHVAAELAAALTLTTRSADGLLGLARELARLRPVMAALMSGLIDLAKARVFVAELATLGDVAANEIAQKLLGRAPGWTTSQLRRALRAAVLAFDPAAGRRRAAKARAETRVEAWQEGSGNAALAGRELPAAEAIAADRRISQLARLLKGNGATGTMDQLRADVYLALLLGKDPSAATPATAARAPGNPIPGYPIPGGPIPGGPIPGGPIPGGPIPGDAGLGARAPGACGPSSTGTASPVMPGSLTGVINLTLPAMTWLGLADRPGELAGLGPIDAETARDLAAMLSSQGTASWHVTLTNGAGQAIAHACPRGQPPPPHKPRSEHASPEHGSTGGANPGGGSPGGASTCRASPGGASPGGASTGPPGAGDDPRVSWLTGQHFEWLEQGNCSHSRQTTAYQPGRALRHLLAIRNPVCVHPGCRRPAEHCDNEHTVPFDQGGRTCECNCGPTCRRHHRTKQEPGWRLAQPRPGVLRWTTPSGRAYVTEPDAYPT